MSPCRCGCPASERPAPAPAEQLAASTLQSDVSQRPQAACARWALLTGLTAAPDLTAAAVVDVAPGFAAPHPELQLADRQAAGWSVMSQHQGTPRCLRTVVNVMALAATLLWLAHAHAAPGAHGPDGEHLDTPGAAVNASGLARLPHGSLNVPKTAQRRMAIRTVLVPESEAAATVESPVGW